MDYDLLLLFFENEEIQHFVRGWVDANMGSVTPRKLVKAVSEFVAVNGSNGLSLGEGSDEDEDEGLSTKCDNGKDLISGRTARNWLHKLGVEYRQSGKNHGNTT